MLGVNDLRRVDSIQQKVHDYVKGFSEGMLAESWINRRELVAAKRLDRAKVREELKEDLVWLVRYIQRRVQEGAGQGALGRENATIQMIVEVL